MPDFESWFEEDDDELDDDLTFEDVANEIEVDPEQVYKNHILPQEIYKDIFGKYEN